MTGRKPLPGKGEGRGERGDRSPARTGRRPGKPETREAILEAARDLFAEHGYDGTSIRRVATAAGVDPALVHHYFATKQGLFMAVIRPPIDPMELIARVLDGPPATPPELAERLVRMFLTVWDDPVTGAAFRGLLRGAVANDETASLVREFFATQVVRRVLQRVDIDIAPDELPFRATLVASQLFGMALLRYLLAFEPLASAPIDQVVAAVAPTVCRYLAEPIGLRRKGES